MLNSEFRKNQPNQSALEALFNVFVPPFVAAVWASVWLLLFFSVVALLLSFFITRSQYQWGLFSLYATIITIALYVVTMQIMGWIEIRLRTSAKSNSIILVIFIIYSALAFSTIRYFTNEYMPGSYEISDNLLHFLNDKEISKSRKLISEQQSRIEYLDNLRRESSSCKTQRIIGLKSYINLLIEKTAPPSKKNCTSLLIRHSEYLFSLKRSSLGSSEKEVSVVLSKKPFRNHYELWVLHDGRTDIGLIPGFTTEISRLNEILKEHYESARTSKISELIDLQIEREVNRISVLEDKVKDLESNRDFTKTPFIQFSLSTIGEFIGMPNTKINAISYIAQIIDVIMHAFRYIFFLIFFDRLIEGGSGKKSACRETSGK